MASRKSPAIGRPGPAPQGEAESRLDVVVVAYQSARHIGSCLDAIEQDRITGSAIIVVDNASPDDSSSIARDHPSHPTVLRSESNLGFGGACNLAARQSMAEYLFFLNPDARPRRGAIRALRAALLSDPTIGAAGPRIVDADGFLQAASAGFEPSIRSALGHFLMLARLPVIGRLFRPLQLAPGARKQRVDWVGGAAMMVRMSDFRRVGGFDQSLFLYMEDVDLCRRIRLEGRGILYDPAVVVEHDVGGSQGEEQPVRWYWAFHRYVSRHHGEVTARAVDGIAAVGLGVRAVVSTIRGKGNSKRLRTAALAAVRAIAAGRAGPGESELPRRS